MLGLKLIYISETAPEVTCKIGPEVDSSKPFMKSAEGLLTCVFQNSFWSLLTSVH